MTGTGRMLRTSAQASSETESEQRIPVAKVQPQQGAGAPPTKRRGVRRAHHRREITGHSRGASHSWRYGACQHVNFMSIQVNEVTSSKVQDALERRLQQMRRVREEQLLQAAESKKRTWTALLEHVHVHVGEAAARR